MYKKYIVFILILIFLLVVYYINHPLKTKLLINNHILYIDLALNEKERVQGLSGRKNLKEDYGMLFVYPSKEKFEFWMKDMNFPLDFIWISDTTIVDLSRNIPIYTNNQFTRVKPVSNVNKILEVNAGTIDKYSIKIGDNIIIRN
jgi:uncharacterized protein